MPLPYSTERLRGLYVITSPVMGGGHLAMARAAVSGGAALLQLRDKDATDAEFLRIARELRELTRAAGCLFLLNDRVHLVEACEADGVHIGPEDMPITQARSLLPASALLGVSCGTVEEALEAEAAGATYAGVGPVFPTGTKLDAGPAIGPTVLREIARATRLPVAAIGGIDACNIQIPLQAGASMACVISAVGGQGTPERMVERVRELAALCASALESGGVGGGHETQ